MSDSMSRTEKEMIFLKYKFSTFEPTQSENGFNKQIQNLNAMHSSLRNKSLNVCLFLKLCAVLCI